MEHKPAEKRRRLPAWLNAVLWSVYGVLGAVLTICILTASLLWLIRWALPTIESAGTTPVTVTGEAAISDGGDGRAATEQPITGSSPVSETGHRETGGDTVSGGTDTTGAPSTSGESGAEPSSTATPALIGQEQSASVTPPVVDSTSGLEADATASPSPDSTTATEEASLTSGGTATPPPTFTPVPSPTFTATPTLTPTPIPLSPQEYIVQRDDWLSKLSDKFYGDILAYPAIVRATNAKSETDDSFTFIEDPDVIEVGQKLWIPTAEEAADLLAEEEE